MTTTPMFLNHLPHHRARLIEAGKAGNVEEIDRITDELAAMGEVRERTDSSRFTALRAGLLARYGMPPSY